MDHILGLGWAQMTLPGQTLRGSGLLARVKACCAPTLNPMATRCCALADWRSDLAARAPGSTAPCAT